MDLGGRACVAAFALAELAPIARADGIQLEATYAAEVFALYEKIGDQWKLVQIQFSTSV